MKRFKEIAFITLISFTLLTLTGLVVIATAASAFGTAADGEAAISAFAEDLANLGFVGFLYSVVIGASFLIFDIKWISAFWKRTIHLVLNYAVMITVFIVLTLGRTGQGAMAFVLTFAFIVVYFLGMLICRGLKKLETVLDEIKKSKKI